MAATGDDSGISLLSIDGGGVRGLSALYVLERLMNTVNKSAKNNPPLKPCDYFDMIGGTSTGGIIAIMLGRLRMDVQDCISAYIRLSGEVFTKKHHRLGWKGNVQGRFDHEALERVIQGVVTASGLSEEALLKDENPNACKVFVCALSDRSNSLVTFTSYDAPRVDRELLDQATIMQACRATSAASSFFAPLTMRIGSPGAEYQDKFIDGALGYNNPIRQLWTEAGDVWGGPETPLESKIACIVSIGTGKPVLRDFSSGVLDMGQRLLAISTESEKTASQFYNDHRQGLVRAQRYYRFNVEKGLENIGLEEAKETARIIRATKDYLVDGEVFVKLGFCAEKMAMRELITSLSHLLQDLAKHATIKLRDAMVQCNRDLDRTSLAWFTNTTLYDSWKLILPGSGVEQRFIWYPTRDFTQFGALYSSQPLPENTGILYLDCSLDKYAHLYKRIEQLHPGVPSIEPFAILWSLAGQMLYSNLSSVMEVGRFLDQTPRLYNVIRKAKSPRTSFDVLKELLKAIFSIDPQSRMTMVFDHVEALEAGALKTVADVLKQVLTAKELHSGARGLFVGRPTDGVMEALSSFSSITEDTDYHECLRSLRFDNMERRKVTIAAAEAETNHWIWSHPSYKWWDQEPSGILWIEGKPGSGKSVLARSIQKHMLSTLVSNNTSASHGIVSAWFYSIREQLRSHHMMLRSLILQILEQDKSLFSKSNVSFSRKRDKNFRPARFCWDDFKDLVQTLLSISRASGGLPRVYCVLDGLDESQLLSRSDMLSFLRDLVEPPSRVKVICLSRPAEDIEKTLRRCYRINLQQVNYSDIVKIVDAGLSSLVQVLREDDDTPSVDNINSPDWRTPQATPNEPQHKYEDATLSYFTLVRSQGKKRLKAVGDYLLKNANGVILWISTTLKALEAHASDPLCNLQSIEKELYALPLDLEDLYQGMVEELVNKLNLTNQGLNDARRALMWVSVATSTGPFQLHQLLDALTWNKSAPAKVNSWSSFWRQLQRLCGPFIEILSHNEFPDGDTSHDIVRGTDEIQLLHQTVKDFLENKKAAGPFFIPYLEAEQTVRRDSASYLSFALPLAPYNYTPLRARKGNDWESNVSVVVSFLKQRPLLQFILKTYQDLRKSVSNAYDFMMENIALQVHPKQETSVRGDIGQHEKPTTTFTSRETEQSAIVEMCFLTACIKGYSNAMENLLLLVQLKYANQDPRSWFVDEPAIIHGCLFAAVRHKLAQEVEWLVLCMAIRGFDLMKTHVLLSAGRNVGLLRNRTLSKEEFDRRIGAPTAKDACQDPQRHAQDYSDTMSLGFRQTTLEIRHFLLKDAPVVSGDHPQLTSVKVTEVREAISVFMRLLGSFNTKTDPAEVMVEFLSDIETCIHIDEERFMSVLKGGRKHGGRDVIFHPTAVCGFAAFIKTRIHDRKARVQWITFRSIGDHQNVFEVTPSVAETNEKGGRLERKKKQRKGQQHQREADVYQHYTLIRQESELLG